MTWGKKHDLISISFLQHSLRTEAKGGRHLHITSAFLTAEGFHKFCTTFHRLLEGKGANQFFFLVSAIIESVEGSLRRFYQLCYKT